MARTSWSSARSEAARGGGAPVVAALLCCVAAACDGGLDERTCTPRAEECNGHDDDCDGAVDTDESGGPLRRDCSNACGSGEEECVEGEWSHCSAPQPSDELCNGFDDDCDGLVDEENCGCRHGTTRPCGSDVGECELGVEHCENGEWGECLSSYDPADHPEVCDGLDNDCDGTVDESCSCMPGEEQPCGTDVGECREGTMTCSTAGSWGTCTGETGPGDEVCDGLDNNCDGAVDSITSIDFGWSADDHEANDICDEAEPMYNSSGVAEAREGQGWISVNVDEPTDLASYPTLYPTGDEDWYSIRAVEGDRGFCWPWETKCAYVLRVQLSLLDRDLYWASDQEPEDYRLCVGLGTCFEAMSSENQFCTHLSDFHEDGSYYMLTMVWGAGCGDASKDVKVQVSSPTGGACGHYQLHLRFDYEDDRDCP